MKEVGELKILSHDKITTFEGFISIDGRDIHLGTNDIRLLFYCYDSEKWASQIARHLKISVKNVSVRIDKLEGMGLIESNSHGTNKKFIKTKINIPFGVRNLEK
jgi:DNA-binding MarR family transcriptional regulator